jgi:pantoate--beta-alanine ligase
MKKKLQIIKSIRVMQKRSERYRRLGKKIGLVPTMGALHEGHISLIKKSVRQNDFTVVSIFVNPTQFGPDEDFSKYPRAFKSDCRKALEAGANIIFNPPADEIYPDNFQTYIDPGPIARRLEGAARPGHMRGVATVCIKLFNICLPHHAYFGQKDAQQLAMIRSVVRDLNFDLKIVRCPIVRTKTGVALSSRHSYLSGDDLRKAEVIYDSLKFAKKLIGEGEISVLDIESRMRGMIESVPGVKVEYIAFNRWDDLEEVIEIRGKVLISLVVVIGGVRLLDNIIVNA